MNIEVISDSIFMSWILWVKIRKVSFPLGVCHLLEDFNINYYIDTIMLERYLKKYVLGKGIGMKDLFDQWILWYQNIKENS